MPNLQADASGVARLNWNTALLSVPAGQVSVVGRSVIVHRGVDGPKFACGLLPWRLTP
jgi:Cu/Zn superoxide dismutase